MNITAVSFNSNSVFNFPIVFLFWGVVITYVLHVFEETILPEIFVEKVKRLYWPQYSWNKFFWFNTFILIINISAVLCFEGMGGKWIIFPLVMAAERFFNGLYHLFETILTKKFSSGLFSSIIHWIICYMIIRYALLPGEIRINYFLPAVITGFCISFLMIGYLILIKVVNKTKTVK